MKNSIKTAIAQRFRRFDPELILLFGSRARGDSDAGSDIDVIVVYRTDKRFLDRLEELYLAWDVPIAIDILAYTPEEFETMRVRNDFIRQALAEGEVIYER